MPLLHGARGDFARRDRIIRQFRTTNRFVGNLVISHRAIRDLFRSHRTVREFVRSHSPVRNAALRHIGDLRLHVLDRFLHVGFVHRLCRDKTDAFCCAFTAERRDQIVQRLFQQVSSEVKLCFQGRSGQAANVVRLVVELGDNVHVLVARRKCHLFYPPIAHIP